MKFVLTIFLLGCIFISCKESASTQKKNNTSSEASIWADSTAVYQTDDLIIKRLSEHIYQHISYLQTDDFGKVPCNGMLVINGHSAVVFDTPSDGKSSLELIHFVTNELKCDITALIPTHFHNDCVGGLSEFEAQDIPIYATTQTVELLKANGQIFSKPIKEFDKRLTLPIADKTVYAEYFGEGHTKDNIVGYFPENEAVFGGCLIKELGASKGYVGDATIEEWSETVEKVKRNYPKARIVIPGHGTWGGTDLFDYTIHLFKN